MPYGPIFGVCAVWPVFWRLRAGQKSSNTCEFQYLWLVAGGGRLGGVLSLAIHISPNNGAINMIQSDKLVVNVLTMH